MNPISTAPRDRPIRLLCDDGQWRVGHWWRDDRWWLGRVPGVSYVLGRELPDPMIMTASHWEECK